MDEGSLREYLKKHYGNKAFLANGKIRKGFAIALLKKLEHQKEKAELVRKLNFYINTAKRGRK